MMASSSLDKFSPEILLLIFDQIESTAPESLRCLRLASRSLNQLAISMVYRKATLRFDILEVSSNSFIENVSRMVYSHVKEVTIDRELDWDLAAQFLTKCHRLETLTWDIKLDPRGKSFPKRLRLLFEERPNLGLNITSIIYDTDWVRAPSEIQSYPAANLLSFNVNASGRNRSADPLQEFLAASRRLQTLIFRESTMIFHPNRGRLPPIQSLKLPTWYQTRESAKQIWDFSFLQDLEMRWTDFIRFLKDVPPKDLGRLKRFRVDDSYLNWSPLVDWEQHKMQCDSEVLVGLLSALLNSRHDFQELDIRCTLTLFDMSLIAAQGKSLLVLKLLDVAGFRMEGSFPTVSLSDLTMIQQSCTCITKLDIGINIVGGETKNFLDIISRFRNLHDLTIYTQSKLLDDTVDDVTEDVDRQTAMDMKDALVLMKQGIPFSDLSVNVGGWKEIGSQYHRSNPAWERRRKKGMNPERLFIFERSHEEPFRFRECRRWLQKPWPGSE